MENSFGFDEPSTNSSSTDEQKNKSGSYPCDVCGKVYNVPSKLHRHVRVHSGEKPYTCDVCGRRFARSDHVKTHMKTHSTQVKEKSVCRICNQKYTRDQHLVSHLDTVHKIKTVSMCEKCGEAFDSKEKLSLHERSHGNTQLHQVMNGRSPDDLMKGAEAAMGPLNPSHNYVIGAAKFCPSSQKDQDEGGNADSKVQGGMDDVGEQKIQKAVKRKWESKGDEDGVAASKGVGEGSTMVDTDENMFILQHALQGIKDEPNQFEFENLNGEDIEALGDKALLEEINEHIDPEKGAMPVHMEAGTHQIDESHRVTEIVVFPKPGAKVTTYNKPVTAMTAYENKIVKNPNVPIKVEAKKLMGPASYKAKMKKKIELNCPNPADKVDLKSLVYNVGLDPNKVCVDSTDRVQEDINARNVAKKKESANKVTGKGMHKCEHCHIYFEDKAMSLLHGSLHNADDADPFTCKKCLKKLGNRLEFTAHLVWHLEPGMDG